MDDRLSVIEVYFDSESKVHFVGLASIAVPTGSILDNAYRDDGEPLIFNDLGIMQLFIYDRIFRAPKLTAELLESYHVCEADDLLDEQLAYRRPIDVDCLALTIELRNYLVRRHGARQTFKYFGVWSRTVTLWGDCTEADLARMTDIVDLTITHPALQRIAWKIAPTVKSLRVYREDGLLPGNIMMSGDRDDTSDQRLAAEDWRRDYFVTGPGRDDKGVDLTRARSLRTLVCPNNMRVTACPASVTDLDASGWFCGMADLSAATQLRKLDVSLNLKVNRFPDSVEELTLKSEAEVVYNLVELEKLHSLTIAGGTTIKGCTPWLKKLVATGSGVRMNTHGLRSLQTLVLHGAGRITHCPESVEHLESRNRSGVVQAENCPKLRLLNITRNSAFVSCPPGVETLIAWTDLDYSRSFSSLRDLKCESLVDARCPPNLVRLMVGYVAGFLDLTAARGITDLDVSGCGGIVSLSCPPGVVTLNATSSSMADLSRATRLTRLNVTNNTHVRHCPSSVQELKAYGPGCAMMDLSAARNLRILDASLNRHIGSCPPSVTDLTVVKSGSLIDLSAAVSLRRLDVTNNPSIVACPASVTELIAAGFGCGMVDLTAAVNLEYLDATRNLHVESCPASVRRLKVRGGGALQDLSRCVKLEFLDVLWNDKIDACPPCVERLIGFGTGARMPWQLFASLPGDTDSDHGWDSSDDD
jgi:hypothetical protein